MNFFFQKLIYVFVFQKLAHLLYEAATDCSYVNPKKVEDILDVSQQDPEPPSKRLPQSVSRTDAGQRYMMR